METYTRINTENSFLFVHQSMTGVIIDSFRQRDLYPGIHTLKPPFQKIQPNHLRIPSLRSPHRFHY